MKPPNGIGSGQELINCVRCRNPFLAISWDGITLNRVCEKCQKQETDRQRQVQAEAQTKWQNASICEWIPDLYRDSDRKQMEHKNTKILSCIDQFEIGEKGLYLHGAVGSCKTRGACILLMRYCRAGYSIAFVRTTRLAQLYVRQFMEQEQEKTLRLLKSIKNSSVLLIDDIGKEKATERFETELYELLEFRTSTRRITLFTSNLPLRELHKKFSDEQGLAIIRRIVDFSIIAAV